MFKLLQIICSGPFEVLDYCHGISSACDFPFPDQEDIWFPKPMGTVSPGLS